MLTESRHATTVLTEHIELAHSVAMIYLRSHPRLEKDECLSLVNVMLCELPDLSRRSITKATENLLRSELRRVTRHAARHEALAFDSDGDALQSMRSLREAPSLNPRAARTDGAPHGDGFLDALLNVRDSAVVQTCVDRAGHYEYGASAHDNRSMVAGSQNERARRYQMQQHEDLRALKRAA